MPGNECIGVQIPRPHYPSVHAFCPSYLSAEPVSYVSVSPALAVVFAPWHSAVPPPQTRNAVHPQAGAEIQPAVRFPDCPIFPCGIAESKLPAHPWAADVRCWHLPAVRPVSLRASAWASPWQRELTGAGAGSADTSAASE